MDQPISTTPTTDGPAGRLQRLREGRGLTRQALAQLLGRSQTKIKQWERADWAPPEVWEMLGRVPS